MISITFKRSPGPSSQSILDPLYVADKIRLGSDDPLNPQAGLIVSDGQANPMVSTGTTAFMDNEPSHHVDIGGTFEETRNSTNDESISLAGFFERPFKVAEFEWAVNGDLTQNFDIWDLWATNTRVANRLSNFRNFRGKLHFKLLLNGNQFYWSRALLSYTPYTTSPFVRTSDDALVLPQKSQRPHFWIDPSSSQGGEMTCPFYYPFDCLDMTVTDAFKAMGNINIVSISPLRQMNDVANPITFSLYVWATDVVLTTPTTTNIAGLSPQAGIKGDKKANDEYAEDGPLATRATQVARAMEGLSILQPEIAEFTVPAAGLAEGVAAFAKKMGYCKPRNLMDIAPLKIWQTSHLATIDSQDTSQTLALTSKQGVTIDPRTVGLSGADELAHPAFYQKESYLFDSAWSATAVVGDIVASLVVTPMSARRGSLSVPASTTGTALMPSAVVAAPYEYWRGTMKVRFQIACSGYHKGRLLVVWDPITQSTVPEQNVQYSRVVDIAKTKDFEVEVGWGSNKPALRVGPVPTQATYRVNGAKAVNQATDNGVLTVFVLNPLARSGSNSNDVKLVVSTSFTELEVWGPDEDTLKDWSYFPVPNTVEEDQLEPQAGIVQDDAVEAEENAAPEGGTPMEAISPHETVTAKMPLITHGESVLTFRATLKRFQYNRSIFNGTPPSVSKIQFFEAGETSYPYYRGYNPTGLDTYQGQPFNYGPFNIHSWICGCFSGWKGSMRIKMIPTFSKTSDPDYLEVHRGDGRRSAGTTLEYDDDEANYKILRKEIDESWEGAQRTLDVQGNVLDVEVPWYTDARFANTYVGDNTLSNGLAATGTALTYPRDRDTDEPFRQIYDIYRAIGEDWNCFFFTGLPPIWEVRPLPTNT